MKMMQLLFGLTVLNLVQSAGSTPAALDFKEAIYDGIRNSQILKEIEANYPNIAMIGKSDDNDFPGFPNLDDPRMTHMDRIRVTQEITELSKHLPVEKFLTGDGCEMKVTGLTWEQFIDLTHVGELFIELHKVLLPLAKMGFQTGGKMLVDLYDDLRNCRLMKPALFVAGGVAMAEKHTISNILFNTLHLADVADLNWGARFLLYLASGSTLRLAAGCSVMGATSIFSVIESLIEEAAMLEGNEGPLSPIIMFNLPILLAGFTPLAVYKSLGKERYLYLLSRFEDTFLFQYAHTFAKKALDSQNDLSHDGRYKIMGLLHTAPLGGAVGTASNPAYTQDPTTTFLYNVPGVLEDALINIVVLMLSAQEIAHKEGVEQFSYFVSVMTVVNVIKEIVGAIDDGSLTLHTYNVSRYIGALVLYLYMVFNVTWPDNTWPLDTWPLDKVNVYVKTGAIMTGASAINYVTEQLPKLCPRHAPQDSDGENYIALSKKKK